MKTNDNDTCAIKIESLDRYQAQNAEACCTDDLYVEYQIESQEK